MATNQFFNLFDNATEQQLYEDLVGEFVQTWGIDVIYLPKQSNTTFDLLFGDDPTKTYGIYYTIECYIQSTDNFDGQEIFSKMGVQVAKQARFLMPRKAFQREVGLAENYPHRPLEGGLLWLPNFQALFEIKFVDEEYFFYPFGRTGIKNYNMDFDSGAMKSRSYYGWSLVCEKFRFNDESIVTGLEEIDTAVNQMKFVYDFQLSNVNSVGSFVYGEVAFQTNNGLANGTMIASANVVGWVLPNSTLSLTGVQGVFNNGAPIFGSISGAKWNLGTYNMANSTTMVWPSNDLINQESNTVLNFSETNKFGTP